MSTKTEGINCSNGWLSGVRRIDSPNCVQPWLPLLYRRAAYRSDWQTKRTELSLYVTPSDDQGRSVGVGNYSLENRNADGDAFKITDEVAIAGVARVG